MKCVDCKKRLKPSTAYLVEDKQGHDTGHKRCYTCFSKDYQKQVDTAWTDTMLARKATLAARRTPNDQ